MKKATSIKLRLSGLMSMISRIIAFIFLIIISILIFTVNNFHWLCLAVASLWTGHSMWNEFGKAMALFSFFVVLFLGCIAINTERKNETNN